eukprot:gene3259-4202_t
MLLRVYGHEALMAHFLVLAALQRSLVPWRWGPWLALGACSVLVHPYLALMTGVLGIGAALSALALRELAPGRLAMQAAASLALCGALAWAAGYFIGGGSQVSSGGHGFFSANLLTWADPMNWQAFLAQHGRDVARGREWSLLLPPQVQATAGQYEGFAYLGAGVLVLVMLALYPIFNFKGFKYNPDLLQLVTLPLLVLAYLDAFAKRTLRSGVLLGLAAALALMTKYWVATMIGAVGLAALIHPARMALLRSPAPWAALVTLAAAMIPHIIWLRQVDFVPFTYA